MGENIIIPIQAKIMSIILLIPSIISVQFSLD